MVTSTKITFQLPSYEILELDLSASIKSYDFTVGDLKHKLIESGFRVSADKIRLIQSHMELMDDVKIRSENFVVDKIVEVVIKLVCAENSRHHFRFDEFVRKIEPFDGQTNVSLLCRVEILFTPNAFSHVIYIPALMSNSADIFPFYAGNMMDCFCGNKSMAAQHGYKEWPTGPFIPKERLLLLEVDEALDLRLESIRYDADSTLNYEYDRGDSNSWQRYTTHLPIECQLKAIQSETNEGETTVIMTPFIPLKRNTSYAILLCNNVPTIPLGRQDSELHSFLPCGLCEDRLYIFRTED
jgi:hypothetical protein